MTGLDGTKLSRMSIIDPMITFEIPALHVYCEYRCDGAIVRSDGAEDENLGVPLAITSVSGLDVFTMNSP